ncbi:MAG TPA: nitrilase-related carbon-nitrogen hydrolase [Terriglobales bacterium]|nr:nitrilase-related carbon-nitrogen hydrolase [Terriglobales bacterium]
MFRIALANLHFPASPEESVELAEKAIRQAAGERADLICFPECYVPGYRAPGKKIPLPDTAFLEHSSSRVAQAAARAKVAVVLGTERVDSGRLLVTALVIDRDGIVLGFQDKVQIDPSEELTYSQGCAGKFFKLVASNSAW